MISVNKDTKKIISTLKSLLYSKKEFVCYDILCNSNPSIEYQFTDFNIDYFSLNLGIDANYYSEISVKYNLDEIQDIIYKELEVIFKNESEYINQVIIKPYLKYYLNWNLVKEYNTKDDFINDIIFLRDLLISTSTGEKRIENENDSYISTYEKVDSVISKLDLENPNPFKTLWESYNYWSSNLDSYAKRRTYFSNLYYELLKLINTSNVNDVVNIQLEYTNWDQINRTIADIKKQYNEAITCAQFNGIGAMCRNVYNSLADTIYKEEYHVDIDIPVPNENQYKSKLLEFVLYKLDGKTNEDFRSHCKKMIDLADTLTHKKTATRQQAALTINAVISILNIITILNENAKTKINEFSSVDSSERLPF